MRSPFHRPPKVEPSTHRDANHPDEALTGLDGYRPRHCNRLDYCAHDHPGDEPAPVVVPFARGGAA